MPQPQPVRNERLPRRAGQAGLFIVANLVQNAATAQQIIARAVEQLPFERTCECASALKFSLITRPEAIPAETRRRLGLLIDKYLA